MRSNSAAMRRTPFIILLALMVSSSRGEEFNDCTDDDFCLLIQFTQQALTAVKDDIGELRNASSQLQKSNEEISLLGKLLKKSGTIATSTFKQADLDGCRDQLVNLTNQILNLEFSNEELASHDEGWDDEMETLRKAKEDLIRAIEPLEIEERPLVELYTHLEEHVWNLTMNLYYPADCGDWQIKGKRESAVYTIYPYENKEESLEVLCDLESNGGGWTVFFTRQPQQEPIDFNESWLNFKSGFGNISTEFWLGNDLIHLLTSFGTSMLRIDAEDFNGDKRWAEWNVFNVGDEDSKYQLTLEEYQNTSTMGDSLSESSNSSFTTFDQDNDEEMDFNCALGSSNLSSWGKGGWWYSDCGSARLTAPLMDTSYWNSACYGNWDKEGMKIASLKTIVMKFRRVNYEELAVKLY